MDKECASIRSDVLATRQAVINDFSITIASVNGSGSQTANLTLMRALFKMGIPVSGKNIFPSNIQGMPTWYTLRLSDAGFLARREAHEVVVAMNPATFTSDLADVAPGGVFFYDDSIKASVDRQDIAIYPMPIRQLVKDAGTPSGLRDYIANMVYVGVVAQIIEIDTEKIWQALEFQFKGKQKAIDLNWSMVKAAFDWASANLKKTDPYFARPSNKTEGFILADGNTAAAMGSLYGGMHFCAWYPITPATTLAETINEYAPVFRKDPVTGKNTCVVVQAEDELAAVGMIVGAGFAGLRAMTSTSGPGISLMTEYVGLAYYAEVPIVLWDVQRVGPSTGLPTRTSQGDLKQVYFMGHGDTKQIMLLPGSVTECFEFGWQAFDLADQYQTPVFVLSDLDFGMNQWMTLPFQYPDTPINRGKILWEEDLERIAAEAANGKNLPWGRYLDMDGDGIPYRTVPGNRHPAASYFARGTGHDEYGKYSESAEVWERNMKRLKKKIDGAVIKLPKPVVREMDEAEIGFLAFGSTDDAIAEAIFILAQSGQKIDYMRLRALPSPHEVGEFIQKHRRTYVIELNRDGQLCQILTVEFPDLSAKLVSLAHLDGMPLSAKWLIDSFWAKEVQ